MNYRGEKATIKAEKIDAEMQIQKNIAQTRIDEYIKNNPEISASIKQALEMGKPSIGMNKEQVSMVELSKRRVSTLTNVYV
jgi:hypothetical protein